MGNVKHGVYSNHFKAKIALKAVGKKSIKKLSSEYAIPCSKIEAWVSQVKDRAELLFIDEKKANKTDIIRNNAALLRNTLDASPNGIFVKDLNQNIITYNQKCIDMWKVPEDIVASGNIEETLQYTLKLVKNADLLETDFNKAKANPRKRINNIIQLKDGRFFEQHSVPYKVDGEIIGRVITFVDITEYKRTEQKLSKFVNLLHSINANVNEGIFRSTPDQGLVYVNDAFVKILGYRSKEEALATDPAEFYAEKWNRLRLVKRLQTDGGFTNEEVLFRRKNGSTFWGLENSTMVVRDGQKFIDGVITDINEWKKAEQALRKSEEKYRTILKNIEEGYFEMNLAGDFTFFNGTLVEMMRYSAEDMIGMNNREYMDEANAKKVYETFNRVYETGISENRFDWELICGDELRIYVEASVTLRKDSEGNAIGFSGMLRDVTERKKKQKQIKESLKEKEVLLSEIHHRVKNNLAVISGLLYLQADKTDDEKAFQALMQSQSRINSMALIHELLYDNQAFASLKPISYIKQLVKHIVSNLNMGRENIETRIEAESFDLKMNMAIPCALIINELLTNAFKYAFTGNDHGVIKIIFRKKNPEDYHLEVVDNGRGLPANFDITDNSHHSLGLSLVKTLSRQLHGDIKVENKGAGARFIIKFKG